MPLRWKQVSQVGQGRGAAAAIASEQGAAQPQQAPQQAQPTQETQIGVIISMATSASSVPVSRLHAAPLCRALARILRRTAPRRN
eukprot:2007341-Amphidinium_carterae.1